MWQALLDITGGFNKVDGIIVMLINAGRHGKNIRIKDDIFGRKMHFFSENLITAGTDFAFPFTGIGLPIFIKRHDDNGCAITAYQLGLFDEFFLTFLETDRVDDALALNTFETGFNDFPFGGVNHNGNAADIRFGSNQVEESHHRILRIEHAFIHIDIDDLCAVFNLLSGNL